MFALSAEKSSTRYICFEEDANQILLLISISGDLFIKYGGVCQVHMSLLINTVWCLLTF